VPTYSCIEGWIGEDRGTIAEDPRFVDPDVGCVKGGRKLWLVAH